MTDFVKWARGGGTMDFFTTNCFNFTNGGRNEIFYREIGEIGEIGERFENASTMGLLPRITLISRMGCEMELSTAKDAKGSKNASTVDVLPRISLISRMG